MPHVRNTSSESPASEEMDIVIDRSDIGHLRSSEELRYVGPGIQKPHVDLTGRKSMRESPLGISSQGHPEPWWPVVRGWSAATWRGSTTVPYWEAIEQMPEAGR